MQQYLLLITASLFITAYPISMYAKTFKVIAEPPDSAIRVVSGSDQKEQKFRSPAVIAVNTVTDSARTGKNEILEVSKDSYKTATIPLHHINDGDTIRIKLEKIFRHQVESSPPGAGGSLDKRDLLRPAALLSRQKPENFLAERLTYRLLSPVVSSELAPRASIPSRELIFRDKAISLSLMVGETSFQMEIKNRSEHPMKIIWERAEYTDIHARRFRVMNSGIRHQDRNNPVPDQTIQPGKSVLEVITPVEHVFVSSETGNYEVKPLLNPENGGVHGLKGKTVNLFIPIEINRAITPYNFKIQIMSDWS